MSQTGEAKMSYVDLLTVHRELLVSTLKSVQCLLDNLSACGFFCEEDVDIVQQTVTRTEKVRKILEVVQCKGEQACEYFLKIIFTVRDAYIDLQPWLKDINYVPSCEVTPMPVVNTDPISRYCEKLRDDMIRDTSFIMSYGQREEAHLEELYTDTLMELLNDSNERLGFLESLDHLLGDHGVFNPHGETIYVMGDAGVGKSLLLQKLQNLWSKKELQTDAIFFFKFRCRMFNCFKDKEQISLRELLFKYNCYPDHDPDNEVFDYILRFPEKVIFTFDGYDEVQEDADQMNAPEVASPEDKAYPLQLLMGLLCGKLLKGSQKVVTARTGIDFRQRVVRKKVALRGFSPAHLKTYISLHFKEQEHRELVSVQLDASPHLWSLCSTPLFCWITFKSFRHLHNVHDSFHLPDTCVTLTGMFLMLSEVFLSHAASSTPSLLKNNARCTSETFRCGLRTLTAFAKLAIQGVERDGFIFSQEEVSGCGLTEEELSLGFLRAAGSCDGSPMFEFLHATLQSFLAAFALVLNEEAPPSSILRFFTESRRRASSCQPFRCCIQDSSKVITKASSSANEHLQFTNLFLCGLLAKANMGLIDLLASPNILKKKRSMLKSYLSASVRSHLQDVPQYKSSEGSKIHGLSRLLWLLRCIFETGSKEIAQRTARGIPAGLLKLAYLNMFSSDCTAVSFVLQHQPKLYGLDMDNNNIGDYGVKQLRPMFSKLTILRLSVNNLYDGSVEVLAEEICKYKVIQTLGLYSNHLTDVGAELVARVIEECPKLQVVKIGKNNITHVGGRRLAAAIQKSTSIFDVGMWGNCIGDEGAEAFSEALKNHPSLTNLSLSVNGITSRGGRCLAEALQHNSVLRIFWLVQNEFTDEVAPHLAELIRANTGLSHLWLISNRLTVEGIGQLAEALGHNTTLKEICVKGNQVSGEEEKLFATEKRLFFH
ncbi:nucleotide-binding oligomerization domain-containing protein 1 [Takifugu flavidus]|uniref:nucleotide-binding oligomerization domain-containing protein 1 n=1 Tax=Takifugu flavidus TaxID=433684 RepID=UPI00254449F0|nr:nucleotide-binding oligomerization domain-containing protein 1 [Takifugu flavidus]XP_056902210.1 nucleotide-binding oligomerization domain-containing protein 1 [Takifugu flavidus]